jgi:orotate phosphoribosyltransferase
MTFDLSAALLDAGAVRLDPKSPFTWSSGLKSPIYCDNRQLLGFPEVRESIKQILAERARTENPTLIAGTSTAGIPWATMLADHLRLPLAYVRPDPKKHGMVEGPLVKGHRVVLVEDLLSTGGSSLRCVDALRAEGAQVCAVLALFSYGLAEAQAAFATSAVPFQVLTTFEELASTARSRGAIDESDWISLQEWKADTQAWSRRFS